MKRDATDMTQRGIYLKCRQMANGRAVKSLQFRENFQNFLRSFPA
jgi:hypothetical protein